MELYGSKGSIIVPDPNMFGGPVFISGNLGSEWKKYEVETMHLGKTNIINHSGRSNEQARQSNYRGIGLSEMIHSIENNKLHRCNGDLALHVLDIIETTINSVKTKTELEIISTCHQPAPFTEKEIQLLLK